MNTPRLATPGRRNTTLQHLLFGILMVLLCGMLTLLAYRTPWGSDVSLNQRNTLSDTSAALVNAMQGPIEITAFVTPNPEQGDIPTAIRNLVHRYQRVKPDISFRAVNSANEPQLVLDWNIKHPIELVIKFQGREEHLSAITEDELTNALVRLSRNTQRIVGYLEGHGERSLHGSANFDLGLLGAQLKASGLHLTALDLSKLPDIPNNSNALVITQPAVDLTPPETAKIVRFVERGGNLLWLLETEKRQGLEPLAELLGVSVQPGVVIDPAAAQLGAPITWALSDRYSEHPVTQKIRGYTVFPNAQGLSISERSGWQATPLIEVAPTGWVELGKPDAAAQHDPTKEAKGPVTLAYALQRELEGRQQRVVVLANGDWAANQFSGNGANLLLGMQLSNWLVGDHYLVAIPPRTTLDRQLVLTRGHQTAILVGGMVVLPLLLLLAGGLIWWKRRR